MTIVPFITEIELVGVNKRNIANEECIVLRVGERMNLGQYFLLVAFKAGDNLGVPLTDNLLWLGDQVVDAGTVVLIYTGKGTRTTGIIPNTTKLYTTIHWGRSETIFNSPQLAPLLVRFDSLTFGTNPPALPSPSQVPWLSGPAAAK